MQSKLLIIIVAYSTIIPLEAARSPLAPRVLKKANRFPAQASPPKISSEKTLATLEKDPVVSEINLRKRAILAVNCCALLYAGYNIYTYYHLLQQQQFVDQSRLCSLISKLIPSSIITLQHYHKLVWYSLCITGETLVYKTIAHCLITCTSDTIPSMVSRAWGYLRKKISYPTVYNFFA